MAIQRRSCWRRSRQKSHVLTVEFIDRAPTVRFYDHTGHISAAVCRETSLHALTDGRRHDHREGCEEVVYRGREGVTPVTDCNKVGMQRGSRPKRGEGAQLGHSRELVIGKP